MGHMQCVVSASRGTSQLLRPASHRAPKAFQHAFRSSQWPGRRQLTVRAAGDDKQPGSDREEETSTSGSSSSSSSGGIPAVLLLFVSSAAYTVTNLRDELGDILAGDDTLTDLTVAGFGLGDLTGALLWSAAIWYASPLQLLLVFLGKIDTERPSDWLMYNIGRAAQLPVDQVDYAAPAWVKGAAASACVCGGLSIAALLGWSLGDPTWSISSGIGALFAAAVFEAGRPKRLSADEAKTLEAQWQDFAAFANTKLQRSGRCHESEVFSAFRRTSGRYRSAEVLPDSTLRDMVRNWHPGVERTRTGYLKNVSLQGSEDRLKSRAAPAAAPADTVDSREVSSGSDLLDSIAQAAAVSSTDESSTEAGSAVEEPVQTH